MVHRHDYYNYVFYLFLEYLLFCMVRRRDYLYHHNLIKSDPINVFLAPGSLQISWSLIKYIKIVKGIIMFVGMNDWILS